MLASVEPASPSYPSSDPRDGVAVAPCGEYRADQYLLLAKTAAAPMTELAITGACRLWFFTEPAREDATAPSFLVRDADAGASLSSLSEISAVGWGL